MEIKPMKNKTTTTTKMDADIKVINDDKLIDSLIAGIKLTKETKTKLVTSTRVVMSTEAGRKAFLKRMRTLYALKDKQVGKDAKDIYNARIKKYQDTIRHATNKKSFENENIPWTIGHGYAISTKKTASGKAEIMVVKYTETPSKKDAKSISVEDVYNFVLRSDFQLSELEALVEAKKKALAKNLKKVA